MIILVSLAISTGFIYLGTTIAATIPRMAASGMDVTLVMIPASAIPLPPYSRGSLVAFECKSITADSSC
jgi:hypothetical protein